MDSSCVPRARTLIARGKLSWGRGSRSLSRRPERVVRSMLQKGNFLALRFDFSLPDVSGPLFQGSPHLSIRQFRVLLRASRGFVHLSIGPPQPSSKQERRDCAALFISSLAGTPRPRERWWLLPRGSQVRLRGGPERAGAGLRSTALVRSGRAARGMCGGREGERGATQTTHIYDLL
jgi:hypothetical protein